MENNERRRPERQKASLCAEDHSLGVLGACPPAGRRALAVESLSVLSPLRPPALFFALRSPASAGQSRALCGLVSFRTFSPRPA